MSDPLRELPKKPYLVVYRDWARVRICDVEYEGEIWKYVVLPKKTSEVMGGSWIFGLFEAERYSIAVSDTIETDFQRLSALVALREHYSPSGELKPLNPFSQAQAEEWVTDLVLSEGKIPVEFWVAWRLQFLHNLERRADLGSGLRNRIANAVSFFTEYNRKSLAAGPSRQSSSTLAS